MKIGEEAVIHRSAEGNAKWSRYVFTSLGGRLRFHKSSGPKHLEQLTERNSWRIGKVVDDFIPPKFPKNASTNKEIHWRGIGFCFATGSTGTLSEVRHLVVIVPYWLLVIPLTLFSGFLLFTKSKTEKPRYLVDDYNSNKKCAES